MDLAELLTVETSVLQALCMSTGSESTELRDTILRELEQDDFYFPITRTIYAAVSSMSRDNSPVDAESLLRALSRRSVDIPDDFFLEDPEPNAAESEAIRYIDEVLQVEDIGLVESVQRGMQTPAFTSGRIVSNPVDSGLSEHGVHHFGGLLLEAYRAGADQL